MKIEAAAPGAQQPELGGWYNHISPEAHTTFIQHLLSIEIDYTLLATVVNLVMHGTHCLPICYA